MIRIIRPALGDVPISKLRAQTLETFYSKLRKCRAVCNGKPLVDHRTTRDHECRVVKHIRKPGRPSAKSAAEHDCTKAGCTVIECKPHVCRPMASSSIRQIHAIISGSLDMALRWEWISTNPAAVAKKPRQDRPDPAPPSADEAALIAERAFTEDIAWGTLIWLQMTVGARRGEVMALRFSDIDFDEKVADPEERRGVVEVRRNYVQRRGQKFEKDTKSHQMRRVSVDPYTLMLLAGLRDAYHERMAALSVEPDRSGFVFSYEADNSNPCNPDGITHRYGRMCRSLGIKTQSPRTKALLRD